MPELTPFRAAGTVVQPVPLPSVEPQLPPRHSVYDSVDDAEPLPKHLESLEPPKQLNQISLPVYSAEPVQLPITVTPSLPQIVTTKTKTTTIEEWDQGSIGEQPPQPSKPLKAIASAVKTATAPPLPVEDDIKAGGDSALAFSGNIGTPPPGFREAFGLNGAEELFPTQQPSIKPETTTTTPKPTTTMLVFN